MTNTKDHRAWRTDLKDFKHIDAAWRARVTRGGSALIWEDQQIQAQELEYQVSHGAHWLETGHGKRGVRPGDRVMLVMDNGPAMLASFLACQRLGAIAVPISHRASPERLSCLAKDCTPTAIVLDDTLSAHRQEDHQQQDYAPLLRTWPNAWPACNAPPVCCPITDPGTCALIQYTSGSTADAKGVMISHAAVLANVQAFSERMEVCSSDVYGSMLPLFHDMGLMCFGLAPLLLGCPLVLHRADALSLRSWLESIGKHGVTISGAPDTLLALSLRVIHDETSVNLQSLRMLICGSEPVHPDTLQAFAQRWNVKGCIKPAYGMAELTLCATLTAPAEDFVVDTEGHVSNGRPITGVSVRIRPEQPDQRYGEIMVRSPASMMGYWRQTQASKDMFDAEGYLHTGDIGYLDNAHRLFVLGRERNVLIRGGKKHSPHDLEMAARSTPGIRRAAVIQAQDRHAQIICLLEVEHHLLQEDAQIPTLVSRVRLAIQHRTGLSPDICACLPAGCSPVTDNGKVRHALLRTAWENGKLPIRWREQSRENGANPESKEKGNVASLG